MRHIDADALIKKIFPYDLVDKRDYSINAKAVYDAIQNAPTEEVVPKEIERFLYMNFRFCKEEIGNDDTQYIKGRLELNTQIQNLIAELKKKYTEGEAQDG